MKRYYTFKDVKNRLLKTSDRIHLTSDILSSLMVKSILEVIEGDIIKTSNETYLIVKANKKLYALPININQRIELNHLSFDDIKGVFSSKNCEPYYDIDKVELYIAENLRKEEE